MLVVGASTKRGHLLVEYKGMQVHVPYQYMEFASGGCRSRTHCSSASTRSASSRKDHYYLPPTPLS